MLLSRTLCLVNCMTTRKSTGALGMFKNYLLITLRGLKKQPIFSAVKILSLAIGLGCSILVIMHVQYANSFDKHFPNWENIYRVVTSITLDFRMHTEMTNDAAPQQLVLDYPQIESLATIRPGESAFSRGDDTSTNSYYWANQDAIDVFSFDFFSGDSTSALTEPFSVLLTEASAEKYFPDEDPFGQTLTLERETDLRVTGIIRDLPENTHIDIQMLISASTGRELFGENFMQNNFWNGFGGTRTYITVPDQATADAINADLPAFMERNLPDDQKAYATRTNQQLSLEPLADIYLSPRQGFGQSTNNRSQIITGLGVFASLILITSCINFANLSFSQIWQRSKEIGVRKTMGAQRGQLLWQFLIESLVLTVVALLIALPMIYLSIPLYTNLTDTGFTIADSLQSGTIFLLILFVLLTGLLSGLFPSLTLARFEPASIIKGFKAPSRLKRLSRSAVTTVQFGFSTALIILAFAVTLQIRYLNTMDIGFTKENLLMLDSTYDFRNPDQFDYDAMVNEIAQHPGVLVVAKASVFPPNTGALNPWRLPSWGPDQSRSVRHILVDENYLETMELRLLAGRAFSPDFSTDFTVLNLPGQEQEEPEEPSVFGVMITREAAMSYGFGSPEGALGEQFLHAGNTYQVIGVVEDFRQSGGLEDPLTSTYMLRANRQNLLSSLLIRLDASQLQSALDHIDSVWNRHRPDLAIDRTFYEQTYNELVGAETRGINFAAIFASIITVLISAFGLYALAFYSSERRTKEVGVRKVLGATSTTIIGLLTWDFVKPVLVACALACGLGYYAITIYFQQFSSQVEISPLLYLLVIIGTILVAIVTVAMQCYRTANADPVDSLRYE